MKTIFVAQALDNTSPDLIMSNGVSIPEHLELERQSARHELNIIHHKHNGPKIHGHDIRSASKPFVGMSFELPTKSIDVAGRHAPVAIAIPFRRDAVNNFKQHLENGLSESGRELRGYTSDYVDSIVKKEFGKHVRNVNILKGVAAASALAGTGLLIKKLYDVKKKSYQDKSTS